MNLEVLIERIKSSMKRNNTNVISCPTGKLNDLEIKALEKHFQVEKEPFGDYKFTKNKTT